MSPEDPNYILWILELISASMSLLGSFFNMMMFIIFKDLRNEATELIFCLSISSFFTNFSYLIINPIHINDYKDEKICKIQGFSIIIFEISQSLWATLISYSAFRNTVFQNYEYTCIRRTCYLLIGFGFPFLISLTILLFNGIGKNERWCWINQEKFWLQTAIYIFMWLLIFISFYYIRIVILYLKRIFSDRNERELVNKFTLRIKFIPIIQACCMIPATIGKILHKFYNSQPLINVFDFPIPIFINIQGFFYSLVFGFHPQVKEHLASFCQKFRCCKDKEDSNTDSLSSSSSIRI